MMKLEIFYQVLKKKQGMTLLEIVIALGIIILFTLGSTSILIVIKSHVQTTENSGQRNLTIYNVTKNVSQPNTLKISAQLLPQNEKLSACLLGGPLPSCASNCCTNDSAFDFYVLDPILQTAAPTARKKLTGITNDPILYSLAGDSCDPTVPPPLGCAYQITTNAMPHCPGGTATCDHAEYLAIHVEVKPLPNYFVKPQILKLIHFVNLNYKPIIPAVAAQILVVNEVKKIFITPNPGFPLEPTTFLFSKCTSSDTSRVMVSCYGFHEGQAAILIEGKAAGTANITLQVNDAQEENFLSDDMIFAVTVN